MPASTSPVPPLAIPGFPVGFTAVRPLESATSVRWPLSTTTAPERLAKARAMMADREYVIPDDLVTTAVFALSHRIIPHSGNDPKAIVEGLLGSVDVEA